MKRLLMVISLIVILGFAFACQQAEEVAEEPVVDIDAEEAAVREAHLAFINAVNSKDVDSIISFYADDAILILSGDLRDKIWAKDWWGEHFSKGNYWNAYPPDKIGVSASGDLAYSIHGYDFTSEVDGEPRTTRGINDFIWKKQIDGSWKISVM